MGNNCFPLLLLSSRVSSTWNTGFMMPSISLGIKVATSLDLKLATTAILVICCSDVAPSQRVTTILYLRCLTLDATQLLPKLYASSFSTVLQNKIQSLKNCVWYMGMHTHTPTHTSCHLRQINSLCVQGWYSRAHLSLLCTKAGCVLGSMNSHANTDLNVFGVL